MLPNCVLNVIFLEGMLISMGHVPPFQRWAAQIIKLASQVHMQLLWKSWAASVSAGQKKISPQAQLWRFEKYNSNWLTAQTALDHSTKPIFKTSYVRYQISKQKIIDFL